MGWQHTFPQQNHPLANETEVANVNGSAALAVVVKEDRVVEELRNIAGDGGEPAYVEGIGAVEMMVFDDPGPFRKTKLRGSPWQVTEMRNGRRSGETCEPVAQANVAVTPKMDAIKMDGHAEVIDGGMLLYHKMLWIHPGKADSCQWADPVAAGSAKYAALERSRHETGDPMKKERSRVHRVEEASER